MIVGHGLKNVSGVFSKVPIIGSEEAGIKGAIQRASHQGPHEDKEVTQRRTPGRKDSGGLIQ